MKVVRMKKIIVGLVLLGIVGVLPLHTARAVDFSEAIARYFAIDPVGGTVQNGSIVSMDTENNVTLSKIEYDPGVIGIVVSEPAISLKPVSGDVKEYPVLGSDRAMVLVDISKGDIKKGDYLTSSTKPGVGMKADKIGYVIGVAVADSTATSDTEGYVLTDLKLESSAQIASIGQANGSIRDNIGRLLTVSTTAMSQQPSAIFKYIMAGLVIILALVFSSLTFMRLAYNSIEALGRNPLGTNAIIFGIIVNGFLGVLIVAGGFGVSYLLLTM